MGVYRHRAKKSWWHGQDCSTEASQPFYPWYSYFFLSFSINNASRNFVCFLNKRFWCWIKESSLKLQPSIASEIMCFFSYFHSSYNLAIFLTSTCFVCDKRVLILNITCLLFMMFLFPFHWPGAGKNPGSLNLLAVDFVLVLIIFVKLVTFELKSIKKNLTRPPIKDFFILVFPIKSLNSSNIDWQISLMVSPRPSVKSLFSIESSNIINNDL